LTCGHTQVNSTQLKFGGSQELLDDKEANKYPAVGNPGSFRRL
jgi:hypothetical protein